MTAKGFEQGLFDIRPETPFLGQWEDRAVRRGWRPLGMSRSAGDLRGLERRGGLFEKMFLSSGTLSEPGL